jgi:hypothetical protein
VRPQIMHGSDRELERERCQYWSLVESDGDSLPLAGPGLQVELLRLVGDSARRHRPAATAAARTRIIVSRSTVRLRRVADTEY